MRNRNSKGLGKHKMYFTHLNGAGDKALKGLSDKEGVTNRRIRRNLGIEGGDVYIIKG